MNGGIVYKFIKTKDPKNNFDITNVEISSDFNDLTLDQILETMEDFLKACGFSFDGNLAIVNADDYDERVK